MLENRRLGSVLKAPFERRHYRALVNMLRVYPDAGENLRRYLFERGSYPYDCPVRTPLGIVRPTLHSHHDLLTLNEVFCRVDYPAPAGLRVAVDVGANIGLSALYFLTRGPDVRCHLYEPDPKNVARLRRNLAGFADRITVHEHAVADVGGRVRFGVEPTGRYGGIGAPTAETIEVDCRAIADVLSDVLAREDHIDVLKVDIEGLEVPTVTAIPSNQLARIRRIYFESPERVRVHPKTFQQTYDGSTARLVRREAVPVSPLWARAYRHYETQVRNHPGKRTLARTFLRLLTVAGAGPFAWPVRNGALLAVAPVEGLADFETTGWACLLRGVWEPNVERALRELLRPGDAAVDAGANLGYFSAVMAQAVGPTGRVCAFEPVPDTFQRLALARDLNGYAQLEPLALALGAKEGTLEIAYEPRVTGMASAHRPSPRPLTVPVRALDDLVADGTVPLPSVIKIDVEGHEFDVLRGARATIERARPAIVFELNEPMAGRAGWSLTDVRALLPEYDFFLIEDEGLRPLDPTTYELTSGAYVDVLARPSSASR